MRINKGNAESLSICEFHWTAARSPAWPRPLDRAHRWNDRYRATDWLTDSGKWPIQTIQCKSVKSVFSLLFVLALHTDSPLLVISDIFGYLCCLSVRPIVKTLKIYLRHVSFISRNEETPLSLVSTRLVSFWMITKERKTLGLYKG